MTRLWYRQVRLPLVPAANNTAPIEAANPVQIVPTLAGSRFKGYVDDNLNPSADGAYIEGVTV